MSLALRVIRELHPDVLSWLDRVRQAGGSVPEYGVSAHNRFVQRLIDDGIWQKIRSRGQIFTFATSTFAGLEVPLIGPNGSIVGFDAADYSPQSGLGGGGDGHYVDTNFSMLARLQFPSDSFAFYSRTNSVSSGFNIAIGNRLTISDRTRECALFIRTSDTNTYANSVRPAAGGGASASISTSLGLFLQSRVSATDLRIFRNGTQQGSTATTDVSSLNYLSISPSIFALNSAGTSWTDNEPRTCAYAHITPGLSVAEAAQHYRAVQELQEAYGRAV